MARLSTATRAHPRAVRTAHRRRSPGREVGVGDQRVGWAVHGDQQHLRLPPLEQDLQDYLRYYNTDRVVQFLPGGPPKILWPRQQPAVRGLPLPVCESVAGLDF